MEYFLKGKITLGQLLIFHFTKITFRNIAININNLISSRNKLGNTLVLIVTESSFKHNRFTIFITSVHIVN